MQSTVPIYVMMAGEPWADQSDITAYKDDKTHSGRRQEKKRKTHFGLVERKERGRATLALGRRGGEQRCAQLL